MTYDTLLSFRKRAYEHLIRAHDATFELMEAALTTRSTHSFTELTQSLLFRRRWPSGYEALQDSRLV